MDELIESTAKMTVSDTFECSVCCEMMKESVRKRRIACSNCDYVTCNACQKMYGKLDCMKCHHVFNNAYAMDRLGTVFVTKTAKQNLLTELMHQQKKELETIGPVLKWYKDMREIRKHTKLIVANVQNGDKPDRQVRLSYSFKCYAPNCPGVIVEGRCSVNPLHTGCMTCEMPSHTGDCDPNIVETVKDIRQNSKPCPSCNSSIFKIAGCNHMHCTNCNTHFNWSNMVIISDSTNFHYRAHLIRRLNNADDGNDCRVDTTDRRIPEDVMKARLSRFNMTPQLDYLLDGLYQVPASISSLMSHEYNLNSIAKSVRDKYDEMQCQHLLGEITEKQWEQNVYKTRMSQIVAELLTNIFTIYLGQIDQFQSLLYDSENMSQQEFTAHVDDLYVRVNNMIDMVNQSIADIRTDYEPTKKNITIIRSLGNKTQSNCSKHQIQPKKAAKAPALLSAPLVPVNLYDYQVGHVDRLKQIIQRFHYAIDLSPLGTGKTYSAAKIFQTGPYKHLITISPVSVKTKWISVNSEHGLGIEHNLSYNEIGGRRGYGVSHPLLIRDDYKMEIVNSHGRMELVDKYRFTTTALFERMVSEGMLLVIDEFQHLKNTTAQTDACTELIRSIYANFNANGKSRVLLMSGSPIDKDEQCYRLMQTLGIVTLPKIVSGHQYAGTNEMQDYITANFPDNAYFRQTQRDVTQEIVEFGVTQYIQYAERAKTFAYRWFVEVFKPNVCSSMRAPPRSSQYQLVKYNGVYRCEEASRAFQERIDRAVEQLQEVANQMAEYRITIRQTRRGGPEFQQMMGAMTFMLMQLEMAKVDMFRRLAIDALQAPNQKVVIALNYTDSINELAELLTDYQPLILDGRVPLKKRIQVLNDFQAPNADRRVLIGNFSVMCTGIDLDDKDGRFPRICYASPNLNSINIYQLGHRFMRGLDTKSSATIIMVYSDNPRERRLIESLGRKGEVMKRILKEQSDQGVVFPCDYPTINHTI
jgi:hypothetical protein